MLRLLPIGLVLSTFHAPMSVALPEATFVVDLAPETSFIDLGEDRRGQVAIFVKAEARGFACPFGGWAVVDTVLRYDDVFAGASMNPRSSIVRIDAPGPGLGSNVYLGTPLTLDLFWGESAPHGHVETYTIQTFTRFEGPPCLPQPTVVETVVTVEATYP